MIWKHIQAHPVVAFVATAYAFSWVASIPVLVAQAGAAKIGGAATVLGFVGGVGPALAAVVVAMALGNDARREFVNRLFHWRCGLRWWMAALWLLPLAILVGLGISWAVHSGLEWHAPRSPSQFLPSVSAFLVVMPVLAFLEEAGWRGFLLPQLLGTRGFLTASLVVGTVHAGWHLPLFFVQGTPQAALAFFPYWIGAVLLAVWLTWLFQHTQSVLVATLFHTLLDCAGLFPTFSDPLVLGVANGLGVIAAVAIVIADRKAARRRQLAASMQRANISPNPS